MARPKKIVKTEPSDNELSQFELLSNEVARLKKEKEELERKLSKSKAPSDLPTRQHKSDLVNMKEMQEEDARKIRGTFRCFKPVGGNVSFYFRKWKNDPVEKYELHDGKEYELPLGVVKHLNENCYEEQKSYLLDANGDSIKGAGKRDHRFAFTPLNYGSSHQIEEENRQYVSA